MHIPNGTTDQLTLLTFREALEAAQTPSPDYDITKWLYAPNFYSEYRYILGTRGKKPLICIGVNPSTAEPDHLDNTLKSVQQIAQQQDTIRILPPDFLHQPPAPVGAAVNIGSDQKLHGVCPPSKQKTRDAAWAC